MSDRNRGTDYLALPDVCAAILPYAIEWRETIVHSNTVTVPCAMCEATGLRGGATCIRCGGAGKLQVIQGAENRDEVEKLDHFIATCKMLGLDDDEASNGDDHAA